MDFLRDLILKDKRFFLFYSDMSKEDVEAIGTAFAAETNRRDEDTEMYVKVILLLIHLKYQFG